MNIYECILELKESTYFSSREINNFFQTEPLIGNYALCYALSFCQSPYNDYGKVLYKDKEHLPKLIEKDIYVTPLTFIDKVNFTITQFNGLGDGYFNQMEKASWNYPQIGRIKMLSLGNRGKFYIISKEELIKPAYIRLGKFMSKAKVNYKKLKWEKLELQTKTIPFLLNPCDIPEHELLIYDMINIKPVPLIKNATLKGDFYELENKEYLPMNMKFRIDD